MPRRSKAHASRSAARELALQMLYQADLNRHATEQEIADQMRERLPRADLFAFGFGLVKGVAEHRDALDAAIDGVSDHWQLHRMAATDRNLLRLGCYEMTHTDTPFGVVINEAVDLAKKFGSSASAKFVNGVLDSLVPADQRPEGWTPRESVPREIPPSDPVEIPAHATPAQVAAAATSAPIAFRRRGAAAEDGPAAEDSGDEAPAREEPAAAAEAPLAEEVVPEEVVPKEPAPGEPADESAAESAAADGPAAAEEPDDDRPPAAPRADEEAADGGDEADDPAEDSFDPEASEGDDLADLEPDDLSEDMLEGTDGFTDDDDLF